MSQGYESFFGLEERPFSLTPDPKYFFQSRAHVKARAALVSGFRTRQRFLLVTGDLGVGKTVLCRTLIDELRPPLPVSYVANPLMTPTALERLLLEDFGRQSFEELSASLPEAVIVIDEAHTMPASTLEYVLTLSRMQARGDYLFRIAFIGQAAPGDPSRLGIADIDDRATTTVRLLPLSRDELVTYVTHRLATAGPNHGVRFSARAHECVFMLSGGVPRLINLLCERALQEAAAGGTRRVEASTVERAAGGLQLLRARPRRFRWFRKHAS